MLNKRAFTLTELLLALGIVGAIAALAIPGLVKDVNKDIFTTRLKNFISSVDLAIVDQMSETKAKELSNTAFGNAATVFGEAKFDTMKVCNAEKAADCWNTTIAYKYLNGATTNWVPGTNYTKLKNGIMLSAETIEYDETNLVYPGTKQEDIAIIHFCTDLNGADGPNIIGRDGFCFYVTRRGKIVASQAFGTVTELSTLRTDCNAGNPDACFGFLLNNHWEMDY